MEPDVRALITGATVACSSCGDASELDDRPAVAHAQVSAFISAHESCPNFQITLAVELPDDAPL